MKTSSLLLATALTTALGAGSVLAQTTTAPSTSPASPNATSTAASSSTSATNTGMFWTQDNANEWRASKLKGLNVYNQNNEKLGDIDDILVDQSGQIKAVIIGVGGFLGIGEHNVAVPFNQLQFANDSANRNVAGMNTTTGNPGTTGAANTGLGSPAVTPPAANTSTTASTATPGTGVAGAGVVTSNSPAAVTNRDNGPDRAILNATKDQLKAAPQFRYRS